MALVLKGSHSFTCTPRVHPLTEWTISAFSFPAEAGTHLPTPEGWKAELALGGWLAKYRNKCPAPGIEPGTVAHLSTNRARRRLTSFIKANAPTTTPDDQPYASSFFWISNRHCIYRRFCPRPLLIQHINLHSRRSSCEPTLVYSFAISVFKSCIKVNEWMFKINALSFIYSFTFIQLLETLIAKL